MIKGGYNDHEERPYGREDDNKPYRIVPGQLSNKELLRNDRRVKDLAQRLFPMETIISKGRIINPQQFIVAIPNDPNVSASADEATWKVGNNLWLENKGSRIQVRIEKSRKCSPTGKRYVLIQTVGKEWINDLEGHIVGIFNAHIGGNSVGTIHGGGSNSSGGREHSGGQSNCFGAAQLVKPLANFLSEINDSTKISRYNSLAIAAEVIVAVLDSGILTGPDSGDRSVACSDPNQFGWNFVANNPFTKDDHLGLHGTKVSTIIKHYARNTEILPVKVANDKGVLDLYDVLCGLEYARTHGAKLVNASWSFSGNKNNTVETDFPLLLGAIRDLDESGVMVVAAAGNRSQYVPEADGEIARNNAPKIYPACYSAIQCNVITVTTVIHTRSKFVAYENYSSQFVDTGVLPNTQPPLDPGTFVIPGFINSYEGSSFATPVVAARVANVLSVLTGFASKRTILRRLAGFHEEDDLVNEIRDGGCYVTE
ncbi:S8 family peptidase [Spirosoma jeollabukense]